MDTVRLPLGQKYYVHQVETLCMDTVHLTQADEISVIFFLTPVLMVRNVISFNTDKVHTQYLNTIQGIPKSILTQYTDEKSGQTSCLSPQQKPYLSHDSQAR